MAADFTATLALLDLMATDTGIAPGLRNDAALLAEQLRHAAPPPAPTAAAEQAPTDPQRVADRVTTWMADRGLPDRAADAVKPAAPTLEAAAGIVRRRDMLPLPGYLTDVGTRIEREYRGVLDLEPALYALSQTIELTPAADRLGAALRGHFSELVKRFLGLKERVLAQ